jgi:hypothetical protein
MPLEALVLSGSWLLILTVLALDLTGVLHRGTGFRWQATGLLIMNTAGHASAFAHHHGWAGSQMAALDWATLPMMLIGFAAFIVGLIVRVREPSKARRAE